MMKLIIIYLLDSTLRDDETERLPSLLLQAG